MTKESSLGFLCLLMASRTSLAAVAIGLALTSPGIKRFPDFFLNRGANTIAFDMYSNTNRI